MTREPYLVEQLDELAPQPCPCGTTRRGFVRDDNDVATVHLLDATLDTRAHYHKRLTEITVVLEGEGHLEVDGQPVPVRPYTAVLVRPGVRHRPVGRLRALTIPIPAFDPDDEWFD
ncbi:MAG TPA: cupin domain-containing protein [Egibacteraceae bacterium]